MLYDMKHMWIYINILDTVQIEREKKSSLLLLLAHNTRADCLEFISINVWGVGVCVIDLY